MYTLCISTNKTHTYTEALNLVHKMDILLETYKQKVGYYKNLLNKISSSKSPKPYWTCNTQNTKKRRVNGDFNLHCQRSSGGDT